MEIGKVDGYFHYWSMNDSQVHLSLKIKFSFELFNVGIYL